MIEGFVNHYPIDSDDDGNEIQVWEDDTIQPATRPMQKTRTKSHHPPATQWATTNFRPGTAPDAFASELPRRAYSPKDLSSPPTTLSETNFALKMAARSSHPVSCFRSSPDSFTRSSTVKKRASSEKKSSRGSARSPAGCARSAAGHSGQHSSQHSSLGSSSPYGRDTGLHLAPSPMIGPTAANSYLVDCSSDLSIDIPSPQLSSGATKSYSTSTSTFSPQRHTIDAGARVSHKPRQQQPDRAANNNLYAESSNDAEQDHDNNHLDADTPSASAGEQRPGTKQRKAVSARVARQPVQRTHPVFSPGAEGAVFERRTEYPQRPPSRHREPGQSLGLDVHPEPARLRLRSAHYPSHHERPPSRCKPPNEALHLEDKLEVSDEMLLPRSKSRSSTPQQGAGSKEPKASANNDVPSADREDIVPSAEDNKRREWSAGLQRPAAPATKHKPMQPHITQVPFRTSLSPDFLRLFATSDTNANTPPRPPQPAAVVFNQFNQDHNTYSGLFSDCFSMGMADIPSPEDDPFKSNLDDLCISDDDSDSS